MSEIAGLIFVSIAVGILLSNFLFSLFRRFGIGDEIAHTSLFGAGVGLLGFGWVLKGDPTAWTMALSVGLFIVASVVATAAVRRRSPGPTE